MPNNIHNVFAISIKYTFKMRIKELKNKRKQGIGKKKRKERNENKEGRKEG